MPPSLPPNIQEFNEITAVIFALLYVAHPTPKTLEPEEVAAILGIPVDGTMPSGRTFKDVFAQTVSWLLIKTISFRTAITRVSEMS
jgi:hypothetical protein